MKTCLRCQIDKEDSEFRGYRKRCRPCEALDAKDRRENERYKVSLKDASDDPEFTFDEDTQQDIALTFLAPITSEEAHQAAPKGYHVHGVSTSYASDGSIKQQWVKTRQDAQKRLEALEEALQRITEPFKGSADPVPPPEYADEDLLNVIPLGDPHIGLYAWAQETGQDFDLEIAESNLITAIDHLIALAPPAKQCLIINLGDFFHTDNFENKTLRSGNSLDVDTRWPKVLSVGIRLMRRCIDLALLKHENVHVINAAGNHDDHTSVMLGLCLEAFYHREPRVTIDINPGKFQWFRFGATLIGVTHGDTVKPDKLLGVMATDKPKDWGETTYRFWYCGHIHHDVVKEYPGVIVESFRTLAAKDSWHTAHGYRSGQDLKLDIIHKRWGKVNRHVIGIHQIWHKEEAQR